jgi:hypothetical protein
MNITSNTLDGLYQAQKVITEGVHLSFLNLFQMNRLTALATGCIGSICIGIYWDLDTFSPVNVTSLLTITGGCLVTAVFSAAKNLPIKKTIEIQEESIKPLPLEEEIGQTADLDFDELPQWEHAIRI